MQEPFEQSTIFGLLNKKDIREADILSAKKELSDHPEYIHQIINIE
jgi:hypothetical protein